MTKLHQEKKIGYTKNRYLKKRSYQNKKLYTKQRNFWVSLLQRTKKKHYTNQNHKDIADNKQFWRTVKPLLSDKSKSNEKIALVEDGKIISEDKDNAKLLNSFFSNAAKNLKILAENIPHSIFKAILKYKNYPSILPLKTQQMD